MPHKTAAKQRHEGPNGLLSSSVLTVLLLLCRIIKSCTSSVVLQRSEGASFLEMSHKAMFIVGCFLLSGTRIHFPSHACRLAAIKDTLPEKVSPALPGFTIAQQECTSAGVREVKWRPKEWHMPD